MITCKLCRRVADESPTNDWCLDCHDSAAIRPFVADKQYPLTTDEQSKYTIKYMRSLAKRVKRGLSLSYCECFTRGSRGRTRGSQCQSYGDYEYQGRKVCGSHHQHLGEGYTFDFVGEPDTQQDREPVCRLLAYAFTQAPDDGLRDILARAIDDARNPAIKGTGAEAQGPSEGAGDGPICQDAHVPWD